MEKETVENKKEPRFIWGWGWGKELYGYTFLALEKHVNA